MTLTHLDLDRIEGLAGRLRESGTKNAPRNSNGVYMSICDEAADTLTAMITRIRGLEGAGWQDMSTAPRDGTRIILNWGGAAVTGYYLDNSARAHPWQGWKVPSMENWPSGQPEHWMPFPSVRTALQRKTP